VGLEDEVFERMAVDAEGRSGNTVEIEGSSQSIVSVVKSHGFTNLAAIDTIEYCAIDYLPILN